MHLSNHLGNVLVTVSDRKLAEGTEGSIATGYRAEVLFASDYYPFGMQMPGRQFSAEEYRYGFQGQETDKEWLGGAVSFKYRVHDARIGRFLSVDPLETKYPALSPFHFSHNSPIAKREIEGLEGIQANTAMFLTQIRTKVEKLTSDVVEAYVNISNTVNQYGYSLDAELRGGGDKVSWDGCYTFVDENGGEGATIQSNRNGTTMDASYLPGLLMGSIGRGTTRVKIKPNYKGTPDLDDLDDVVEEGLPMVIQFADGVGNILDVASEIIEKTTEKAQNQLQQENVSKKPAVQLFKPDTKSGPVYLNKLQQTDLDGMLWTAFTMKDDSMKYTKSKENEDYIIVTQEEYESNTE
jgi:RHS repeat-associated protein